MTTEQAEETAPEAISDMVEVPIVEVEAAPGTSTKNDDVEIRNENATGDNNGSLPKKSCGSKCCSWLDFHGVPEAKGYAILGTARGSIVMSNIFLSTSLIYLASEEAGCIDDQGIVIEDCNNKTHGFQPPSLIANIAVISGLLSAFLMPVIGAIVDYTPHRRATGIAAALFLVLIQGVQIGTVSATWFPMLILQAIAGFIYQVEVLATYAYLPEIARAVGEKIMTRFTSSFVMLQFGAQALFLVVVIAFSVGISLNDVQTGQCSQAINVVWISIGFYFGWKTLPSRPSRHELQEGHNIWTEGFKDVWRTAKKINRKYPHGLRWFLLATVFAEAGANAFTVVAVVYLNDQLGMTGTEIGIVFLVTLVASVPGSKLASIVTKKTNPNTSLKLNLLVFSLFTFAGAFALTGPDVAYLAYVFGVLWGMVLGGFYSTENLFFSMVLPAGQEAELTGFFIYCTQILVWLPPLVFALMIEAGVKQTWGLMSLIIFFAIAIGVLCLVAPWPEVLEESAKPIDTHIAAVVVAKNEGTDEEHIGNHASLVDSEKP
jgi:MFS-type transporter involved in bile tolerance (Atg22 family)